MKKVLLLLYLFSVWIAAAATAQESPVKINIPAGFEGPFVASHQSGAKIQAYMKKIPGAGRTTLLQVTTYDFGSQLDGLPDERRGEAAGHYLSQFLASVQQQRDTFESTDAAGVVLDGIPGARVEWHGSSAGFNMSGVMYCVIVGSVVISLHTQGFEDSPAADTKAALAAIDSVTFNR
ncbi:hypothetical protein SAMN04487965_2131 [Microbulbifer donghaiensis]|uniref:Uncharacterized protein n=1 Tax=Microbulbifer donghaiensis TaxID=494016 RepID=A0A1M5CB47_9GAMM|nr:hypothetical protein [Microbulbifer donghaiensis]SHF51994.1 hypothetical protein SAMN04487965_2131 [Microbulbifer donghaiensis]